MFEAAPVLSMAAGTMQKKIDTALVGIRFVAASRDAARSNPARAYENYRETQPYASAI